MSFKKFLRGPIPWIVVALLIVGVAFSFFMTPQFRPVQTDVGMQMIEDGRVQQARIGTELRALERAEQPMLDHHAAQRDRGEREARAHGGDGGTDDRGACGVTALVVAVAVAGAAIQRAHGGAGQRALLGAAEAGGTGAGIGHRGRAGAQ